MPIRNAWNDKIMHAEISLAKGQTLYLSDVFEGGSVKLGDNVTVHITVDANTEA